MIAKSLLEKYNIPAPRYTSYPTVPYWSDVPVAPQDWKSRVLGAFAQGREVSLYIHLPYCENLCTYCGCNKRITKNHQVEDPYIDSVLAEWAMYCDWLPEPPVITELHLGGGTPTFFSPESLKRLVEGLLAKAEIAAAHEFSFEAHPNSTSKAHLQTLFDLGFNRISIGVQDFEPEILKIINRNQTEEQVRNVTNWAREIGYTSVNYDLIFGLPLQTPAHIRTDMARLAELRPDRLAFYSYAHVPWIKPSQRAYSEADLPTGKAKRALYELGRELLEDIGYREIGMDHFALPTDSLYEALETGSLHRNFMGYTPLYTRLSIGLGASAISDSWDGYVQNEKGIEAYQAAVAEGRIPYFRGHLLSVEDEILRGHILNLMCRYETTWDSSDTKQCDAFYEGLERLEELVKDGLVERDPFHLKITKKGLPFVRNICLALDAHYWRRQPEGKLFSQVV
jgi:oxygen-independent coproporphyrinogen-3 oxidase